MMESPMSLLIIFVFLPLLFLLFLLVSLKRKRRLAEQRLRRGIDYVKWLRSLLTFVQQHRGLTTGFINGNKNSQPDIERLNNKVKGLLQEIAQGGDWFAQNSKWSSLCDHWQRLANGYLQGNADNNFKQHNMLIANLLYLIEDVADVHHLARLGGGNLDTDWRYLLSIAEYIGQARALGTGVAARGECSSVMRIQLNHLRNKIASSVEEAWPEQSRREIKNLLHCIESQLVIDTPSISATDYFALATRCIDHVLAQFDQQIEGLQFQRRS